MFLVWNIIPDIIKLFIWLKLNRSILNKKPNRQQQLHKMQGFSGITVSHQHSANPKVERLRTLHLV